MSPRPVLPRLPVEPLLRQAKLAGRNPHDWAATVGINKRALDQRIYPTDGALAWETADELAVALGFHPCEIWPEWWDVAAAYDALYDDKKQDRLLKEALERRNEKAVA